MSGAGGGSHDPDSQGPGTAHLARPEFSVRFRAAFIDPEFRAEDPSIARLEEIAWEAYVDGRKAPSAQKAGPGYFDPNYDLSVEWIATKQRIGEAHHRGPDPTSPSSVLVGCVSTAMPLSHRPWSCYPNHALNRTNARRIAGPDEAPSQMLRMFGPTTQRLSPMQMAPSDRAFP